jgi:hypothetical protein
MSRYIVTDDKEGPDSVFQKEIHDVGQPKMPILTLDRDPDHDTVPPRISHGRLV